MSIYTWAVKAGLIWWRRKPGNSVSSQPAVLYRRCDHLPLDRFIRCICESDLTALIISGDPKSEELAIAWGEIFYEYVELSGSSETIYLYNLQKEISLLSDEVMNVETCMYFLSPEMIGFSWDRKEELVEILRSYGYKVTIDFTTDYSGVFAIINSKLVPKKQKLEGKKNELAKYLESKQGQTITQEHFDSWMIRLWKMQGGNIIRAKDITVKEYVLLIKEYNKMQAAELAKKEDTWQ